MHKHSIEDYKNVIDYNLNDENGKITDSLKFEKVYSEQFYLMFHDIAQEFQYRLKTLKYELIKKLDIKKRDIKRLQVIIEEIESKSESDNESENESDNESIKKSKINQNSNSKDTAEDKMIKFLCP